MMAIRIPFKLSFLSLLWRPVICGISGPTHLSCSVGDHAYFRWNADNRSTIVSSTWGIKRGNVPDPQFITVDIRSNEPHINMDLEPTLKKRLSFDGSLTRGFLWFCLKNVTLDDTNEYLASIFDSDSNVKHLAVALTVKERKKEGKNEIDPTSEKSHSFAATPSIAPRVPKIATTKEAQINATNGPYITRHPIAIGPSTIIVAVLLPLLVIVLAFAIAIFLYKKLMSWGERNVTTVIMERLM